MQKETAHGLRRTTAGERGTSQTSPSEGPRALRCQSHRAAAAQVYEKNPDTTRGRKGPLLRSWQFDIGASNLSVLLRWLGALSEEVSGRGWVGGGEWEGVSERLFYGLSDGVSKGRSADKGWKRGLCEGVRVSEWGDEWGGWVKGWVRGLTFDLLKAQKSSWWQLNLDCTN